MDCRHSNWLSMHQAWCQQQKDSLPIKQAKQIISETESALIRIVLPQMGFPLEPDQKKITRAIKQAAFEFMRTLSAKQLPKAARLLKQALSASTLSQHSQNTYGNRGRNWLDWTRKAGYWPGERMSAEKEAQCAPLSLHGYGSTKTISLTKRKGIHKAYALKLEEMNPCLRHWFDSASDFLIRPNQPGRVFPAIAPYTLKIYQRGWLQLLGWQTRYNNVSLDVLGPEHLFPIIDFELFEVMSPQKQKRLWRKKQRELEDIICSYRDFLLQEMQAFSPHTWHTKLVHMQAAGRILYADWVELPEDYNQLPLFKTLRAAYSKIQDSVNERQQSSDVACLSEKWLEVPEGSTALQEFQKRIVEPMRQECTPRNYSGCLRSPRRFAYMYQKFVRVALPGLLPPLRQQVDRSLQIALSCPVTRPKFVPPEGYYYPLPSDDIREHDAEGKLADNYLHHTYHLDGCPYPEGIWVREVQQQKTRKSLGVHRTIIPNRHFPDGTCFYDYLANYLEGVWWPKQAQNSQPYGWSDPRYHDTEGTWLTAGRSTFNPQDTLATDSDGVTWRTGHLFINCRNGRPYDEWSYFCTIQNNSYRLTGKAITPHTMRYFWATWAFQVGLSDTELRSLAFMMGHTPETLRRMYAKLTPTEQQRPIEEAIQARLCRPDGLEGALPLNKLLIAAHHLSPDEQRQLLQHLQKLLNDGGGERTQSA
jgi:hypothetical protein